MDRWLTMSASALGRAIEKGDIDPIDLTEKYLGAIAQHEFTNRIYTQVSLARARDEAGAASARAKAGIRKSSLDGVPISWKDLIDSADIPTEGGTKLLAGRIPTRDAQVLANATALGLVCLGKTQLSELAFSGLGYNPTLGTTPCVNDPELVSGGSSSGAAGSVAFGLAAVGVGSDTGGSVRIPAAWNDLVGLKTTSGGVSCDGVIALCPRFDTIGPLTRTVEDAALMLSMLEGGKAVDLKGASLSGVRFLVCKPAMEDLRNAPAAAFDEAVKRLEKNGATVDIADMPMVEEALGLSGVLFAAEAYALWKDTIESAPEKMFHEILQRFRGGASVLATDYIAAVHRLDQLRAEFYAQAAGYDAVIMPTSPILPPNIERLGSDSDYYTTENLLALRNTRIGNLMGSCAITLPTGHPSCGLMLCAPPMEEGVLLRLGAAAELVLA